MASLLPSIPGPCRRRVRTNTDSGINHGSRVATAGVGYITVTPTGKTARHTWAVVATVFCVVMCSSEAFASKSHSGLFGVRLLWSSTSTSSTSTSFRGGAAATPSTSHSEKNKNARTTPLTCTMQLPPPLRSVPFSTDDNDLPKKRNGISEQQLVQQRNGVSSSSARRTPNGSGSAGGGGGGTDVVTAVEYVAETKLPTDIGQFQLRAYRVPGAPIGQEPCVIYSRDKPPFGNVDTGLARSVPVRIHDQCLTSEVFRSQRCDCKEQLHMALNYIAKHGGFIIYLQQEGRGIGLANKIAAYALQDVGLDTVDANLHLGFPEDIREYGVVPSILRDMHIGSIHLMTNNPRKVDRLERLGVNVEKTLPMVVPQTNPYNHRYMETKKDRMKHANLAALLQKDPTVPVAQILPAAAVATNGLMTPRKYIADQYINNGTEMTANAVQVSLMVQDDDDDDNDGIGNDNNLRVDEATTADHNGANSAAGVLAREDGYCFGKQSVLDAINAIARGEMVVVVDDMNRENEGDFIMAADACTDLDMAQIVRYSSGVVCIALPGQRMDELKLPPMCITNEDPKGTAFSVTVDATKEHGISTGISASDRAKTVRLLADSTRTHADFNRPGHLFPLRARDGGVLERDGHTEAAIDLARLAGRSPAGILCEIVSEENPTEMMRLPEMRRFAKRHGYVLTSIVDLIQYRKEMGL